MPEAIEVLFKSRRLSYYVNPDRVVVASGDHVIVEAERGIDMGEVRHLAVDVDPPGRDRRFRAILRRARGEDFRAQKRVRAEESEAFEIGRDRIRKLGLEMKLIDTESQIDGNRLTFYFTAEARVDFRELVKDLASIFKTRIELRQIGARDAAKRIGGIGPCGREYCCSTWLKDFSPVTLKMAKNQGLALAPQKISGGCGRLMCCLMYEDPFYKEMVRLFPKVGTRFEIDGRNLRVFANDYFKEAVRLRDEEGELVEYAIEAFPVPKEAWGGAVRARGAPSRGGEGSGCSKSAPAPTGMVHAKGAATEPKGKKRIEIRPADAPEAATSGGGAPFLRGGKEPAAKAPARDAAACEPPRPADLVRVRATERRRADDGEIGSGVEPPADDTAPDLSAADLVASADPEDAGSSGPDEPGGPPRRRRRRRRRGRRPRGETDRS